MTIIRLLFYYIIKFRTFFILYFLIQWGKINKKINLLRKLDHFITSLNLTILIYHKLLYYLIYYLILFSNLNK